MLILFPRLLGTLSTYKELGIEDYIDAKRKRKTKERNIKSKKKRINHYWALERVETKPKSDKGG